MESLRLPLLAVHVLAVLAVVLLLARAGRRGARALGQPGVIGEIVAGLAAGPVLLHVCGAGVFDAVLPTDVLEPLKLLAQAGLVLFLVGLAHQLQGGQEAPPRRATLAVAAGALVPPLLTGLALAGLVLAGGDRAARGDAPLPAFLLMVAVAMSITAVPVMARILTERGMSTSGAGRLALAAALTIDAVGWLLCMVAISLGSGTLSGALRSFLALAVGAVCALAIRRALLTRVAGEAARERPVTVVVLLGAAALAVGFAMDRMGMTAILGAALVGLAIPAGEKAPWAPAVSALSRGGRVLAPAFFVVTGITVLNRSFDQLSWTLIGAAVLLACLGKGLGGYLGARIGGQPKATARKIGVLMNTRGLTELIVLQAGFSAGILSAPLVLALVVMALVTTALTGPLLDLLDRGATRPLATPAVAAAKGGLS